MSEEDNRPRTADWAPGTLDKTRKAIGNIDPTEAKVMSKVLGGQVMYERSNNSIPASSGSRGTGRIIRQSNSNGGSSAGSGTAKSSSGNSSNIKPSRKGRKGQEELPIIPPKLAARFDKLMMSDEYGIKPNYGIFNFVKKFTKNGTEMIIPEFCDITLKHHIDNLQGFITVIKTLIQMAPASYKAKIANGTEVKFKFLRMVAGWTMQNIKLAHIELGDLPAPYVVTDLIPYTKAVYRMLIQVYYYGDTKIPKLIKEIYTDEAQYPDAPQDKLSALAKEAITQWLYIQNEIIKKLYPLLMRMCSNTYEEYPDFFKAKVADILKFVGLHKYDLLLPEKPKEEIKEVKAASKKPVGPIRGAKDAIVNTGLNLLDQLFPQAGFNNLASHPDMYPYFQPLYKFADGFNVMSPENPLQVTVVLLKIVEDCFQGCRNIKFTNHEAVDVGTKKPDSIMNVLDDWSAYREQVFEKLYCDPLNELVNQIYSQDDFENSHFGKKLMTSLLWQVNYHFMPSFKFEQLLLERPSDESKLVPLYYRTDFARKYFTEAVSQCDAMSKSRGTVQAVENPWEHYKFDIPNEISKRLDVLLGAQNKGPNTNANNANLLKYTLCIIAVLDWWINNPDSPAYSTVPTHIFRISEEDGKPKFSVPERNDQNQLFAEQIRAAYQKRASAQGK